MTLPPQAKTKKRSAIKNIIEPRFSTFSAETEKLNMFFTGLASITAASEHEGPSEAGSWSHSLRASFPLLPVELQPPWSPLHPFKTIYCHGNRLNREAVRVKHHSSDIYHLLRLYDLMMGNYLRLEDKCVFVWGGEIGELNHNRAVMGNRKTYIINTRALAKVLTFFRLA